MQNRWNESDARTLPPLDLLVYRSRLIGQEPDLVLWGGGNTSTKQEETDFRGNKRTVLRIKGSGSDLRTIQKKDFPGIPVDDILPLYERDAMTDEEMVAYLSHCLMEMGSPRPSIETLLHGFLPFAHIDHTHADAIQALSNTTQGRKAVEEALGKDSFAWIPYRRPGFALSKEVADGIRQHPKARAIVLEKHGIITFGETARQSYDAMIEFCSKAEDHLKEKAKGKQVFPVDVAPWIEAERRAMAYHVLPILRGVWGEKKRAVLRYEDSPEILNFVNSPEARKVSRVGPATPDHMMNTRRFPLWIDLKQTNHAEETIRQAFAQFEAEDKAYFEKHSDGKHPRLDPVPRVVLLPGIGLVTAGNDARRAAIVADIYRHTIQVLRWASGIGTYQSLPEKDAFEIDYWPLELYKLTLAGGEKELSRRVAFVTGAAGGIGKAVAERFAAEGAHVVIADVDLEKAKAEALAISHRNGMGRAHAVHCDVQDEGSVTAAFDEAVRTYGGIDIVAANAGIACSAPIDTLSLETWEKNFSVNATGSFLVLREAFRILKRQKLGGSIVVIASKNVLVPGKDFAAYSASKAAQAQLAKVMAVEGGPYGIRVNLLHPDAVFKGSNLWSDQLKNERAKAQGLDPTEIEEHYRKRSLLQRPVYPEDVAESALFFASERSSKTTGCCLTIDSGLREAFPR